MYLDTDYGRRIGCREADGFEYPIWVKPVRKALRRRMFPGLVLGLQLCEYSHVAGGRLSRAGLNTGYRGYEYCNDRGEA